MSDAKQNDSDRALAKLLADALRPPDGAADPAACPDAELLSAYAEHNLDANETAQWEEHFAGCARCQKILAVLTVTGDEPLSDAEVQRFGRLAAEASVATAKAAPHGAAREVEKVTPFARPRTAWRWAAPALGIAAVAALWIALRPAPPQGAPVVTAQQATSQAPAPASAQDQPSDSLVARADVPAPPAATPREAQPPQQLKSLAEPQVQKKESEQTTGATPLPPKVEESLQVRAVPAFSPQTTANSSQSLALEAAKANSSEEPTAAVPAAATPRSPAPATAGAAPGAATDAATDTLAARAPSAAQTKTAENKAAESRPLQAFARARGTVTTLADRAPIVIASPDRGSLWRLSAGGRIERSTDQGRTWLLQSSGVTSDLLSAVAPSGKVAWVSGRAGVILRTTDGEHWQKLPSPAATADWTAIEASDALRATVTSADRRRFATEDGGQTWKQQ